VTITDASELTPGETLTAAVAVVGSGPAGLTVARGLADAGIDALVIESGGRSPTPASHDLDVGQIVGTPFRFGGSAMTTADVRIRALGGSSGHWAGMCRPLDESDFARRPWVPGSGWPFDRAELDPYYRLAEATLQLGDTGWQPETWYERCNTGPLFPDDALATAIYQFSPPVRFGINYVTALEEAANPRVILHATAVDVALDRSGKRIVELTIRTAGGALHTVKADRVVVAAGGYEVARLLLSWDGERGIANSSGLVGHGFADQPQRDAGQVRAFLESETPALYAWGDAPGAEPPVKVWAGWAPTPETQEAERITNGVVMLRFADGPDSGRQDPTAVTGSVGPLLSWSAGGKPARWATLDVRTEQRRNDASRITLGPKRDASGLRRIRIDWRPTAADDRTGKRLVELFGAALGRSGVGRVEVAPRGRPYDSIPIGIGCHPMGSARLSDDPADGVADANLRSHDVENLYLCSSAVFPAGGHANPTLTIVALAHRLAAHLTGR
jgi:choline dehydrogenase-like flavoprotein